VSLDVGSISSERPKRPFPIDTSTSLFADARTILEWDVIISFTRRGIQLRECACGESHVTTRL
jgi:hypothetical protein